MKPEFLDNRNGNTLAKGLRGYLEAARTTYAKPLTLSIASGYFNAEGFGLLADQLDGVAKVRLLLGAQPDYPPRKKLRKPGDPKGPRLESEHLKRELKEAEEGLRGDLNLMEFTPETSDAVKRLLAFLASGKIEVRRYEKAFLHGKAFIFAGEAVVAGSSNFTAAGLTSNLELNLGHYQPSVVSKVQGWFDELWAEAVPFDLAAVYRERFEPYEPYLVYLRVLWERYGHELALERNPETGRIPLTTFQNDGVFRALRILQEFHGVVVADGVGLGKTFIAGELIRRVREQRKRVLVVAPATLRDGSWRTFFARFDLHVECVSYEQLVADSQLGGQQTLFHFDAKDISLVVIDEAHAFRNPDTQRAAALRKLLEGSPPKDVVLLTATPVNNSLYDLFYLLGYFLPHDAAFADRGIPSLRKRFDQAAAIDPEQLRPELLFDVLDVVTVRRTRHFVKRFYPNDRVPGPDGSPIPIRFPKPVVRRIGYDLDDVLPGFFGEFAEALMPEHGEPLLTLARFQPSRFRLRPDDAAVRSEAALVGLIRSGLLKRFESSVHAFARTLDRMVTAHSHFLASLDRGFVATAEAIDAISEAEDLATEHAFEDILKAEGSEPAALFDLPRLRAAVEADRAILDRFRERGARVEPKDDPKLQELTSLLKHVVRAAVRDGRTEEERRDNRKILLFSYFAETVEWVRDHVDRVIEVEPELSVLRGRVAAVSGQGAGRGLSREAAVFGFAPRSSEAPPMSDGDKFDILVTTDVLAEGLNLQQCRNVVNYDLPWNPMRLVQRHGRVDRIGSFHDSVYLYCFFPDARLDALLELEARIRRKLAQAAGSIGVESAVIPGGAVTEVVFSETREEIERLRDEDADMFERGGEVPGAHSGEEYRQELRSGIETLGEATITSLPWASGSGFAGGPESGHLFCARVGDRSFLRFIPSSGAPMHRDTLECLRRIACRIDTPRDLSDAAIQAAYPAWQRARRDIYEEWSRATDPANLQPRIRLTFRRAVDHLRRYPPAEVPQATVERTIQALLAPRGPRIEKLIRAVVDQADQTPDSVSRGIVSRVESLGLQPFVPPPPLAPIDEGDIALVCWLAVARSTPEPR